MDLLRPTFKKCIFVAAAVITVTFLCIVVSVMTVREWRTAAAHFIHRTWTAEIEENSTSNVGLFLGSIAVPIAAALLGVANFHWRKKQSWKDTFQNSVEPTVLLLIAVIFVYFGAFQYLLVRGVYNEHKVLVNGSVDLTMQLDKANKEIEDRKRHIYFLDPAMGNLRSLLMDFDMYRHAQKGRPCVMWFTEPRKSHTHLSGEVIQFSHVVSDCFSFGAPAINPDDEKDALDGMVPDAVVFHMDRNDKAARTLADNLGSLLPIQVSYEPLPKRTEPRYSLGPNAKGDETVVWLQFGTDVKWNSERWTAKKTN
jgi:hypothetical protein